MDHYIDNTETQTYGPKLRENLEAEFTDPAAIESFVQFLVARQRAADETMATAMSASRGARELLSKAAEAKSPVVIGARKLLSGFHKHLLSKRELDEWSGKVETFFPDGLTGVTFASASVLTAVRAVLKGLARDASVPDGKKFARRFQRVEKTLASAAKSSGSAAKKANAGLSEQSAEKQQWLRCYRGIALIAEGLLTLEGRADALANVVPHLAAPSGRKKPAATKATAAAPKKRTSSADGATAPAAP